MNEYKNSENGQGNNETPDTGYTWSNPSPYTPNYTTQVPERPKKKRRKLNGVEAALIAVSSFAVIMFVAVCVLASNIVLGPRGAVINNGTGTSTSDEDAPKNNVSLPSLQVQQPDSDALTIPQIYVKVKDSVVGIIVTSAANGQLGQSSGTGIILSEDGYIATNAHVVENAATLKVVLTDNSEHNAELIGYDKKTDIAVIKIDKTGLQPAEFGNSDNLVQGESVVAIGNPYGLELQGTITSGIISALNRQMVIENVYMTLIQTDAAINPGNSGGPLVNMYGQVIGITSSKIVSAGYEYEGIGFAIPISGATGIIEELIQYGYVKDRPTIGIYGRDLDATYAQFYSIPQGVYVEYVNPESDAFAKGLKKGDIITAINGVAVDSMVTLDAQKNNFQPGDTVTLKVFRNTKYIDISVVLSESTSN